MFDNYVRVNVRKSHCRNERNYNRRNHTEPLNANEGDHFYVRNNVRHNKYQPILTAPRNVV